nr:DUF883 family protein [Aeromonas finlandensis]
MNNPIKTMTNDKTADSVEETSKTLDDVFDKTSEVVQPVLKSLNEHTHKMMDELADVAGNAAGSIEQESENLKKMKTQLFDKCREQINDKPLIALGIAISAGFLVGWLLKRR